MHSSELVIGEMLLSCSLAVVPSVRLPAYRADVASPSTRKPASSGSPTGVSSCCSVHIRSSCGSENVVDVLNVIYAQSAISVPL